MHAPLPDLLARDLLLLRDRLDSRLNELLSPAWVRLLNELSEPSSPRSEADGDAHLTRLEGHVRGLCTSDADDLAHTSATRLGLVNLAERTHRIRRLHAATQADAACLEGSFIDVVGRLKAEGHSRSAVCEAMGQLSIEPVFTAHPTEAMRPALLAKEQRMADTLLALSSSPPPRDDCAREWVTALDEDIVTSWQTDTGGPSPSVHDEAKHVFFYLRTVLYPSLPLLGRWAHQALTTVYGVDASASRPSPQVRFGNWVGGDMDGHPDVGAKTIEATLALGRKTVQALYVQELEALADRVTQASRRTPVAPAVVERTNDYVASLGLVAQAPSQSDEPYRTLLRLMAQWLSQMDVARQHRLNLTADMVVQQVESDLTVIVDSLKQAPGGDVTARAVEALLTRLRAFGLFLAALDVRQSAHVHREVVRALLGTPDFVELGAAARADRLRAALRIEKELLPPVPTDAAVQRSFGVMSAMGAARVRYGRKALGLYIISMARDVDDVLAVLFIARRAGLVEGGQVPLDVAPLFETVDDLRQAPETLARMLMDPDYRAHLGARGDRQVVMLGYSDSNKEGGIVASRWALQQAQIELMRVASRARVTLDFFHGRGGTASRGGTKTREAILAEPPGAVHGRMRVTQQGEVIHGKYGLLPLGQRTLELMAGATLEAVLRAPGAKESDEEKQILSGMARISGEHYRALLRPEAKFFDYFAKATPIDVITRLKIGSRPASRGPAKRLADLRAIPWVFAWTQSRQMVPGFFGVGRALVWAREQIGEASLRALLKRSPFLTTLLGDCAMVLAKADLPLAARYASLAGPQGAVIFSEIESELRVTHHELCRIRQTDSLLDHEPALFRAIALRRPHVEAMNLLQIDLLARWREGHCEDEGLERALIGTVKAIARGLQNTG